jgi:hypothetical protein
MRSFAAATVLITLTFGLAGCAGETASTAPLDPPHLVRATPGPRPLTGRCETSFAPPQFPLPPVLRQVDTGTCHLSHLGRAAMYLVQDINFATGTQVSVEFTFTAPNGDVLRATNVGTSAPSGSGVRFQGATTFVGGTGRFANATGEAQLEGTANFLTNTATLAVVDGWIAYDASATGQRP